MEVLDINTFLSFKTNNTVQELDSKTLELISELFGSVDKNKKGKKFIKKTNINILKNQKIQTKKENIVNRVNLILNKLSESNIDNLIIEFLENINQVDQENFDEIQKTIYLKVLSEINFTKIYLQFLRILSYVYKQVQKYDLSFFFSIVESKFRLDYTDWDIEAESKFDFIRDLDGETKRINNLILIKNLVEGKLISDKIIGECDKLILEQKVFLPDIYHWFNSKSRDLTENEKEQVKNHLKKNGITQRETVLLESLVNKKSVKLNEAQNQNQFDKLKSKSEPEKTIKTDTIKLECENIIEEYILIKSLDDIKYFINNRCTDAISKNKFCENLIDRYFSSNKENSAEIIELIKELIKSQTLFKSNLSRGLLLIYSNWKEKSIDYNKPTDKMKILLTMLKSIGITKGIEFLMDQYKIGVEVSK
jgi:hypothetical protein